MQIKSCVNCLQNDEYDKNITFNEDGICNYCLDVIPNYEEVKKNYKKLPKVINKIKKAGKGKKYDCIIGMSGGVDSSYVAHLCKIHELKPLVVHFDNGWNSELAVDNVYKIISKNNFDLFTLVVDWEEFKDLQRAFIKSDVVDIEVPTDHAITASLVKLSKQHKIKYMISGANVATESGMPPDWSWRKADLINIKDIQKKFGKEKLRTFPTYSSFQLFWERALDIENEKVLLNLIDKFQLDSTDFISWKSNNQNCVNSLMDTALSMGIFGVPTFVFEEEIFWGSEKLALISARVTGDYSALT